MTRRRRSLAGILARNTLASWANYAIATLATLLLTPLVIQTLSTPVYGVWVLITQLVGYGGLLDLALQPAVVKYIAEARAKRQDRELRRLLSTAFAIQTVLAMLLLAAVWLASTRLDQWFHLGGVELASARQAWVLLAIGASIGFPASVFTAVLKGLQRQDLVAWLGSTSQLVRAAGLLLVVWRGQGLSELAWAVLTANLVGYVGTLLFMLRETGGLFPRWNALQLKTARRLLGFSFYAVAGTAGWYLIYASDAVVIGSRIGAAEVARYGVALSVLTFVAGTVTAFTATLMPLASELDARGALSASQRTYLVGTRFSLQLSLPLALGLLLWGQELLTFWVGPDLGEAASPVLRILVVAQLASLMNAASVPMAVGAGWQRPAAVLVVCEGVANLSLSLFLAPRMGVVGVALGTLLPALVVQAVVWPNLVCSLFDISRGRYYKEAVLPSLAPMLWILPGAIALRALFHETGSLASIGMVALLVLVYWMMAFRKYLANWANGRLDDELREMGLEVKAIAEPDS